MTTRVSDVGSRDASGSWVYDAVATTYEATVDITWAPGGSMDRDGHVTVDGGD